MNNILTITGLSEEEVLAKLKTEGFNEIPSQKEQSLFSIFLNVLREPMLLLLLGSGLIYVLLGDIKDALMLLSFVIVVIGITFYQKRKTDRALEALRNLSSPRALVIRAGAQKRISGREVVREDILILKEGDRVPADAKIISSSNLSIDESLLTGESLSVMKNDDSPLVYSGTLVVSGHGMAKVTAIGAQSEIGKIGNALQTIRAEETLLQKETGAVVRKLAVIGLILCLIVILVFGLTRGDWLKGFLSGLTLSMAMLPEEFPVVLLIFLTLGAWRISKNQVLTRATSAIETLGAATVLCVDKTGTLTMNQMRLAELYANKEHFEIKDDTLTLPENFHDIIEYGILASQEDPFDPIEKEVKRVGSLYLSKTEHIHSNWTLLREYILSKELLALSHVWQSPDKQNLVIAAKGAPEAIADLCHFDESEQKELAIQIEKMAVKGMRVLGAARSSFHKGNLPDEQHDFAFEFIGLLGFIDPIRPSVPSAIKEAHEAGIRVIMITGDYPSTAQNIARQIGLPESNVYARVVPEQKLAIVNSLKSSGEIVAMTGDGVNDAPALKAAHIGIAMGERGCDVAREASALVLLNDDFSSIIQAIRMGRRIFDNLKKAIAYIFAVHVPIAGMSLLPILFNLPIALLPAHIAFLELIIDPACSVVFEAEPEEKDIMKKPPRGLKVPLFDKKLILLSVLQGLAVLIIVFGIFTLELNLGKGENEARTMAFASLVFTNIMLIITNISRFHTFKGLILTGNKALLYVGGGAILALLIVLYLPFLQNLFHFSFLHLNDLAVPLIGGLISLLLFEGIRVFNK